MLLMTVMAMMVVMVLVIVMVLVLAMVIMMIPLQSIIGSSGILKECLLLFGTITKISASFSKYWQEKKGSSSFLIGTKRAPVTSQMLVDNHSLPSMETACLGTPSQQHYSAHHS